MAWYSNLQGKWTESCKNRKERLTRNRASYIFQLSEYNNEIWLTYNTSLICPMSMFNGNMMEVINKIRGEYITRELKR